MKQPLVKQVKSSTPSPPRGKRLPLRSLAEVAEEMRSLYRDARNGRLEVQTATRLVFILQALGKLLESSDLERRLGEIEKMLEERHQGARSTP